MAAVNINENPVGVEKKIAEQLDREQRGMFVRVDDKTRIFVRSGRDPRKAIAMYKQRLENRKFKW